MIIGGLVRLGISCLTVSAAALPAICSAQNPEPESGDGAEPSILDRIDFSLDARLRYQSIQGSGEAPDADALTLRASGTAEIDLGHQFSVLGEVELVEALIDDFNDGTDFQSNQAVIADPDGVVLNRLQLVSEIIPETRVTLGRQRIALDDWRFFGAFSFRQNDQTADAIRVETRAFDFGNETGVLDVGILNQINRPLGPDNIVGTFTGTSWYANYGVTTPIGRVGAFHYDFAFQTPISDTSTRTTGVRVLGRRHSADFGVVWEASYARQRDKGGNPSDFAANYWLGSLSVEPGDWAITLKGEELGSQNNQSVQTPLASLHGFSGLADQFLVTPPEGLRDLSVALTRDLGKFGPLKNIRLRTTAHHFEDAGGDTTYGNEVDFEFSAHLGEALISFEHARYNADNFSTDTNSTLLSVTFAFDK